MCLAIYFARTYSGTRITNWSDGRPSSPAPVAVEVATTMPMRHASSVMDEVIGRAEMALLAPAVRPSAFGLRRRSMMNVSINGSRPGWAMPALLTARCGECVSWRRKARCIGRNVSPTSGRRRVGALTILANAAPTCVHVGAGRQRADTDAARHVTGSAPTSPRRCRWSADSTRPGIAARGPAQTDDHQQARDVTLRTIHLRARTYRNLVIGIVVTVVGPMLWALGAWSWRPLVAALVVLPLCATFVAVDTWLVIEWRRQILGLWAEGGVDLAKLGQMVTAVRGLPTHTVMRMLDALQTLTRFPGAAAASVATRRSLAAVVRGIDLHQAYQSTAVAAALATAVLSLAAGAVAATLTPMAGAVLAPVVVVAGRALANWRLRRSIPVGMEVSEAGLDLETFAVAADALDWRSVSNVERCRLLARVSRESCSR